MEYEYGAVKQDPASLSTAVRRDAAEQSPMAWAVMHPVHGGHYAPLAEVESWTDMTQVVSP